MIKGMLVRPLPGVDREHLHDTLRRVTFDVGNLGGGTAFDRLLAYLTWASDAAQALGSVISAGDVNRLVWTRNYDRLLTCLEYTQGHAQRVVNGLLNLELRERVRAFEAALGDVGDTITRWSQPGSFLVLDTGFYLNVPRADPDANYNLRDVDLAALSDTRGAIHVIVPIVVVDELDGLKQGGSRHTRWRAGHTLGVFDEIFRPAKGRTALLRPGRDLLRGEVTAEIVLDPPGHIRLPIVDDEIIDRAVAVQDMAARPVTLLTYDTGQATRAANANLPVVKLSMPLEVDDRS